jgi:Flp pilus assembly protein TadD
VAVARARDSRHRAFLIDPDLVEAHQTLGRLYREFDWNWPQAQAECAQALKLDPGNADALMEMADLNLVRFARFDEAIVLRRQALSRDPLDTLSLDALLHALVSAGRLEEAVAVGRKLLELSPSHEGAGANLGFALLLMGRYPEALAASQSEADEGDRLIALPMVYWAMGRRADSDVTLRQLKQKYAAVDAYNIAQAYAWRGETDATFEWLDRAYRQRDGGMSELRIDPLLQHLHGDARYQALLIKMRLNE